MSRLTFQNEKEQKDCQKEKSSFEHCDADVVVSFFDKIRGGTEIVR